MELASKSCSADVQTAVPLEQRYCENVLHSEELDCTLKYGGCGKTMSACLEEVAALGPAEYVDNPRFHLTMPEMGHTIAAANGRLDYCNSLQAVVVATCVATDYGTALLKHVEGGDFVES